jgi:hypothetical protein
MLPPPATSPAAEHCDLCNLRVTARHRHLLEPESRRLLCVCTACALLFPNGSGRKYLLVPQRIVRLEDCAIEDGEWNAMAIPIGLAFFFRRGASQNSPGPQIAAMFPSPAGLTESELPFESWRGLTEKNRLLKTLDPEVEALLVNRTCGKREHYIVPIDRCFELTGLVRKHWRGLSGGAAAWEAVDRFFAALASAAAPRDAAAGEQAPVGAHRVGHA